MAGKTSLLEVPITTLLVLLFSSLSPKHVEANTDYCPSRMSMLEYRMAKLEASGFPCLAPSSPCDGTGGDQALGDQPNTCGGNTYHANKVRFVCVCVCG
ncbi:hypothetical protein ElyMa_006596800 [Elysia marginata]|uniref:Uncharacterized protein n=1 Tax=Elysia marginata TaxID=1093978 RepID=A0AAV4IIF2_9GAST|nr:hypothetical protein ElyMa_006596800 [Elysia marginata]